MKFPSFAVSSIIALFFVILAADALLPEVVTAKVRCNTTKGPLLIHLFREWSPLGHDHFLQLVRDGFYTDIALFRCVKRFLVQFGISDRPGKKHWNWQEIKDDPNIHQGIKKGYLSYAGGGPNTRSSQLFIAFEDLDFLGKEPWETPFGKVVEGYDTLDAFYKGYGDMPPFGKGPDQSKLQNQGNDYIRKNFPLIDFIQTCEVVEENGVGGEAEARAKKMIGVGADLVPRATARATGKVVTEKSDAAQVPDASQAVTIPDQELPSEEAEENANEEPEEAAEGEEEGGGEENETKEEEGEGEEQEQQQEEEAEEENHGPSHDDINAKKEVNHFKNSYKSVVNNRTPPRLRRVQEMEQEHTQEEEQEQYGSNEGNGEEEESKEEEEASESYAYSYSAKVTGEESSSGEEYSSGYEAHGGAWAADQAAMKEREKNMYIMYSAIFVLIVALIVIYFLHKKLSSKFSNKMS